MKIYARLLAAAAAATIAPMAQAAISFGPTVVGDASLAFTTSPTPSTSASFSIEWNTAGGGASSDAYGYIEFTTTNMFSLTLRAFLPDQTPTGDYRSAYSIRSMPGDVYVPGAGDFLVCGDGVGSCDLVSNNGNPSYAQPGDVLASSLAAGTYRFWFYEGNASPSAGLLAVNISEVPLPGAALLFGSALLGAGAIRARRKQAAA